MACVVCKGQLVRDAQREHDTPKELRAIGGQMITFRPIYCPKCQITYRQEPDGDEVKEITQNEDLGDEND